MSEDGHDTAARLEQLLQENRELRQKLRRSESCLDQLQRLANVGYWSHDLVRGEIYWSDHAFRILGVERRPLELEWIVSFIHPDDVHVMLEAMEQSARGDAPEQHEFRFFNALGEERILINRWVSDFDESDNEIYRFGAHLDITEQRRVQQEREQLREQFLHAQKMEAIGRLAGGIAHDFNNLLSAILGNTEMALLDLDQLLPADSVVHQQLRVVQRASIQATSLTRQLLTISRRDVVKPSIVDVCQAIRDLKDMMERVLDERIRLSVVLEPTVLAVRTDAGQLQQILMNLVVNAKDAMPQGGDLVIQATTVLLDDEYVARNSVAESGPHVVVAVSDTGEGISKELQARIFEPFFTTKPEGEGTGLGLATVFGIVERWGGHVAVYSEPGQGSTFKLYFPLSEDSASAAFVAATAPGDPGGSETLLLCEDNAPVLELAQTMLKGAGYKVLAVSHPVEAIRLVEEGACPDLLLTDVIMPELNGRELTEALRTRLPALPTLYLSGYTANVIAQQGILEHGVDLLEKPFTRNGLLTAVREMLDR